MACEASRCGTSGNNDEEDEEDVKIKLIKKGGQSWVPLEIIIERYRDWMLMNRNQGITTWRSDPSKVFNLNNAYLISPHSAPLSAP